MKIVIRIGITRLRILAGPHHVDMRTIFVEIPISAIMSPRVESCTVSHITTMIMVVVVLQVHVVQVCLRGVLARLRGWPLIAIIHKAVQMVDCLR